MASFSFANVSTLLKPVLSLNVGIVRTHARTIPFSSARSARRKVPDLARAAPSPFAQPIPGISNSAAPSSL